MNTVTVARKVLEGFTPNSHFFLSKIYFYLEKQDEILPIIIHTLEVEGKEEKIHALEISLPEKETQIIKDESFEYLYILAKGKIKSFFKADVHD